MVVPGRGRAGAQLLGSVDDQRQRRGPATGSGALTLEVGEIDREIEDSKALLERLEKRLAARTRALPLYKKTLDAGGLADELRARRDHPLHTLLRRMYHETRS